MGNELQLLAKYRADDSNTDKFANRFLERDKTMYLSSRIQDERVAQDSEKAGKKITNKDLIKEQFRLYQQMDEKDNVVLLMNHPGLERKDFMFMLEKSVKMTENSVYSAVGASLGTYGLYRFFGQKQRHLYNFYKKKSSWRIVNYSKVAFGSLALFYSWLACFKYYFYEAYRRDIRVAGLFQKYLIDTSELYEE